MPAKIINRACLLAVAALTLSALLLPPRADILSADASHWHDAPAHRLAPQSLSKTSAFAEPQHAPSPAPASLSKPMQSSPQSYSPTVYLLRPMRIEWLILLSDTIARVKLIQVESHTTTNNETPNYRARHGAELWFEFEVLEYLKGDGKAKIWGVTIAPFHRVATEQEAEAVANYLLNTRDTRWDNAEAIIFLYNEIQSISSASHPNRYALGSLLEGNPPQAAYSLDSVGGWFPLLPSKRAPGPRGARRFLLIDPDFQGDPRFTEDIRRTRNAWRELGASESSDTTTMAVSDLRRLIANESELLRREQEKQITAMRNRTAAQELTATQTNAGIVLRWKIKYSSLHYTTSYRVSRKANGETKFTQIINVQPQQEDVSYEDTTGIEPGVAYTYKVTAILKDDIPSMFNTSYGEYGGEAEVSITTAAPRRTPTPTPGVSLSVQ